MTGLAAFLSNPLGRGQRRGRTRGLDPFLEGLELMPGIDPQMFVQNTGGTVPTQLAAPAGFGVSDFGGFATVADAQAAEQADAAQLSRGVSGGSGLGVQQFGDGDISQTFDDGAALAAVNPVGAVPGSTMPPTPGGALNDSIQQQLPPEHSLSPIVFIDDIRHDFGNASATEIIEALAQMSFDRALLTLVTITHDPALPPGRSESTTTETLNVDSNREDEDDEEITFHRVIINLPRGFPDPERIPAPPTEQNI